MTTANRTSEAERLEQLWSGPFGDEDVDRNLAAYERRGGFWLPLMEELQPASVVEVGCSVGGNLQWIAQRVPPARVVGVDVNTKALRRLEERVPNVRGMHGPARDLPFADRSFDFVFTADVLAHQPDETLEKVMSEMVRVARRWVFCAERLDAAPLDAPHQDPAASRVHRDYGEIFEELFPYELALVHRGHLGPDDGWNDHTWWLFARG
jgi:spore coat polysaccharide biosynthesis protein SpsF